MDDLLRNITSLVVSAFLSSGEYPFAKKNTNQFISLIWDSVNVNANLLVYK